MSPSLAILATLLCFASDCVRPARADPCTQLVLFDFSGARGEAPSEAPPLQGPAAVNGSCEGRPTQVLCSDGAYPEDFLCDFGDLGGHPSWRNLSDVQKINLKYAVTDSSCTIILTRKDNSAKFSFISAQCFPEVSHDTLPPFRVADIQGINVQLNPTGKCYSEEFALSPVTEAGVPGEVRFDLAKYACETNPNYGYLTFGRTNTPTQFTHDGRRFRPNNPARRK